MNSLTRATLTLRYPFRNLQMETLKSISKMGAPTVDIYKIQQINAIKSKALLIPMIL